MRTTIYMNEEDKKLYDEAQKLSGLSLSNLVRNLVGNYVKLKKRGKGKSKKGVPGQTQA